MNVKNEEKLPDGEAGDKKRYRYCVLYTPALAQDRLRRVLKKNLPEGRGTVFSPSMETYRRDSGGELKLKAIFPGYLFIRSDMKADELHGFIRAHRSEFMSFIRELRLSERKALGNPDGDGDYDYTVSDLKDDEAEFLDFLLDIGGTGGGVSGEAEEALKKREGIKSRRNPEGKEAQADGDAVTESGGTAGDAVTENGTTAGDAVTGNGTTAGDTVTENGTTEAEEEDTNLPTEGLLRMSYGYQEKQGKWKVVKGPLRAYESHIADVDNHDKKAYLDFDIGGRIVRAGFDVKPKRYWFPEDARAPEVLADGTEVDLEELKRKIMGLSKSGK